MVMPRKIIQQPCKDSRKSLNSSMSFTQCTSMELSTKPLKSTENNSRRLLTKTLKSKSKHLKHWQMLKLKPKLRHSKMLLPLKNLLLEKST